MIISSNRREVEPFTLIDQERCILIVDNDDRLIQEYKQSIKNISSVWKWIFSGSGSEALDILSKNSVDILITEMDLPGFNGNDLLEVVTQHYPSVIRFVLSGKTSEKNVLLSTKLAHQFIRKPCGFLQLWEIVERTTRLRRTLNHPDLINLITGINKLPSLPKLYVRLVRMLQSENATLKEIGDLISQDVAMTAKLLQLVNSAFFGVPGRVTSPHRAVSLLGLNTIKALVLVIQLFDEFQDSVSPYFSIKGLWRHSISVGLISKAIAAQMGAETAEQDDAYLAGVLHDIGKLIQVRIPGYYSQVKHDRGKITLEAEYECLNTSHAEMGAYLLDLWALPEIVVESIAYHHRPADQIANKMGLATIVNVANGLDIMLNSFDQDADHSVYLDVENLKKYQMEGNLAEWTTAATRILNNSIDL